MEEKNTERQKQRLKEEISKINKFLVFLDSKLREKLIKGVYEKRKRDNH